MVDKVSVNPLSVRGAGDIVSPKSLSDFDVFNSKLVSAEEDVNGAVVTVFTESYLNGSYFQVSAPKIVAVGTESVSISAVLKYNSTDSLINSATVSCFVNDELQGTGTTSGTGVVSFNIPINDYTTLYNVRLRFAGNDNVAGCFAGFKMVQASDLSLDLTGVNEVIQVDESDPLIATLTGTGVDGETIGIPGQTVSFYETYTPCLDVSVNPVVIQSGETATATVQLKDADDGSLVRESGVTVELYGEFPPLFSHAGEITQTYNSGTNVTVLSSSINRSVLGNSWELSFDMKADAEARVFIGDSASAVPTNPQYSIFMGRDTSNVISYGYRTTTTTVSASSVASTDYHACKIVFDNGTITYYVDDTQVGTNFVSFYGNYDNYVVGLVAWGTGTLYARNIILDTLES